MKQYTFDQIPKINATYDENVVVSHDYLCTFESLHCHDYFEIEYICSGSGMQVVNGTAYPVEMGDVAFFDVGDEHSYYSIKGLQIINICLQRSLLRELDIRDFSKRKRAIFTLNLDDRIEFERLIYMIETELEKQRDRHLDAEINILKLMLILFDRIGYLAKPLEERWGNLIAMIANNYATVSLDEAAECMAVSKNYFCKIFKQKFGVSFLQYLNNLRVQRAQYLLTHTEDAVEEICTRVGFTQTKYFYKVFKSNVGITPLKYRKNTREVS